MAQRVPLPFPKLCNRPEDCLGCGYPLVGIPAPGRCPECGLGFDDDLSVLQIAGVPKAVGGPVWRKVVWILIAVVAFVYAQLLMLIVPRYPWAALVIFAGLTASVVAMALTNRQKKQGSEYLAFTRTGFSHWPIGSDPATRVYVDWAGARRAIVLKRVSSVWARLKVVGFDETGQRSVVLDTGFRCPQEDLRLVEQILGRLIEGEEIGEIDGLEHSIFLRDADSEA